MKLQYFILSIVLIFVVLFLLYKNTTIETLANNMENNEKSYIRTEEEYYKYRDSGGLFSGLGEVNNFPVYDASKPLGQQLVEPKLSTSSSQIITTTSTQVDDAVQQCKSISSCDQLDGTSCGYCFYNNKFQYGDENGPLTDVCPGGWVKTSEQCQERRERGICEQVKSCKEMVGEASICAWCPTKNKAFVYKESGGIIVPPTLARLTAMWSTTTAKRSGITGLWFALRGMTAPQASVVTRRRQALTTIYTIMSVGWMTVV